MTRPLARLLIVDDEAPQMRALCDTLEQEGYETTGFTSAKEALRVLKQRDFDLLLTDLMMPEMDGISFLEAAVGVDQTMVGIIMTGAGSITTAVEAMKRGALDYILKPFKLSAILPVLSRALEVRRLRLQNIELLKRVSERTAELEKVNRQLEFANRELEAFSYSVSHDLRAPVRAAKGFSMILAEEFSTQMPDEAQRLLKRVTGSVDHMSHLIEDLLQFSRFSRQPISRQWISMTALVAEVLRALQEEQEEREVDLRISDLPDAFADLSLMRQVLVNLLSNAYKFPRHRQRAVIEITCRRQADEDVYVIRDNGAGFDMRYIEKLFGVFQRLHSADEFEGTGVGLSIVQRIIQRHGGRIWAEAEVDKGATFYFALPR